MLNYVNANKLGGLRQLTKARKRVGDEKYGSSDFFLLLIYILLNRLPYEGAPSESSAANKENDDKKKKNKKKFVKEVRDRSGAVVEAGEAIFQVKDL